MQDDSPLIVDCLRMSLEGLCNLAAYTKNNQLEAMNTRIEHNGRTYSIPAYVRLIRSELDTIEASARVR